MYSHGEIYQDGRGYWIAGYHSDGGPCGPYRRRSDAQQDLRGIKRFHRQADKEKKKGEE